MRNGTEREAQPSVRILNFMRNATEREAQPSVRILNFMRNVAPSARRSRAYAFEIPNSKFRIHFRAIFAQAFHAFACVGPCDTVQPLIDAVAFASVPLTRNS